MLFNDCGRYSGAFPGRSYESAVQEFAASQGGLRGGVSWALLQRLPGAFKALTDGGMGVKQKFFPGRDVNDGQVFFGQAVKEIDAGRRFSGHLEGELIGLIFGEAGEAVGRRQGQDADQGQ